MAVLYDSRGNEIGSPIDIIQGNAVTDARAVSVSLAALNAETVMQLNGQATVMFDVRTAAAVLSFMFEFSIDGTNYYPVSATALATQAMVNTVGVTTTHGAVYAIACSGFRSVRCRVSAWTSGSITVAARGSAAQGASSLDAPFPTTLWVTATAAANTAATATLPAAGAGLFHYITSLRIARNATAALAGSATIIHTTTNLPGSPAWSVGNAMTAGGTQVDLDQAFPYPLRSSVANTATTIVVAAGGLAVLGRVNVGYYVGL